MLICVQGECIIIVSNSELKTFSCIRTGPLNTTL